MMRPPRWELPCREQPAIGSSEQGGPGLSCRVSPLSFFPFLCLRYEEDLRFPHRPGYVTLRARVFFYEFGGAQLEGSDAGSFHPARHRLVTR